MSGPVGSVVVAAHNEEAVIGRTLGLLAEVARRGEVDVVVVCNGCTDRTAEVARGFAGIRVLELDVASKTAALRAGDRVVAAGPRLYLDADIELTAAAALACLRALAGGALAGRPPRRFETTGASWPVRRWYSVRQSLPSLSRTLWGAGCYGLSREGRARFTEFPELTADDLFVDRLFAPTEVVIVATDPVVVRTPRRVGDLLRIRRRGYRAERQLAASAGPPLSAGQRGQLRDLRRLLRREPVRVLDVAVYVSIIAVARLGARWGARGAAAPRWERDTSSRR